MFPQIQESAYGRGRYMVVPFGNWLCLFAFVLVASVSLFPIYYLTWQGQRRAGRKGTASRWPRPPPASLGYLRTFIRDSLTIPSALPASLSRADLRRAIRWQSQLEGGIYLTLDSQGMSARRQGRKWVPVGASCLLLATQRQLVTFELSVLVNRNEQERKKEPVTCGRWAHPPPPVFFQMQ